MTRPALLSALPRRLTATSAGYWALVGGVCLATLLALVAGGGDPLLALAPVGAATIAYMMMRCPLRWSAVVLLVLLLGLDDYGDSVEKWHTPLVRLGEAMNTRLDSALGIPGLAISGMELILVTLLGTWLYRRTAGSRLDSIGQVASARVLRDFVLLYLLAVAYAELNGLAHGQSFAPWKVRNLVHPLALFFLFQAAFRGPSDHRLLGAVVVWSAVYRAILAFVVQRQAIADTGGEFACATNHGDSFLFAVALFLLLADLMERGDRKRLGRALLLGPLIVLGMVENNRRIAWVMLAMSLLLAYLLSPMRGWKRAITRGAIVALPALALYVAAGWNSESRIFAPLRTFRSVSDSSIDGSTYWREVEIFNLATSIKAAPVLGIGLGGEYTESIRNADISSLYKEYREWPHNTVLGLLLFFGVLAFSAMWALYGMVLFLATRCYRLSTSAEVRVAALSSIACIVCGLAMAWGDTGAHYTQFKVLVALAIAVTSKLVTVTGAWPSRRGPPAGAPAPPAASEHQGRAPVAQTRACALSAPCAASPASSGT